MSSSLDVSQVTTDGNAVTFVLEEDASFTYTVQAPDTEDVCCTIKGIFRSVDDMDYGFEDDSVCTSVVVQPTETVAPTDTEASTDTGADDDATPEPTEIPEFPTVIFPVVAILGLMFLLARKK